MRNVLRLLMIGALALSADARNKLDGKFMATAYTVENETASGVQVKDGHVAADPDLLPIGSRIRVNGAGRYSGVYTVTDTGKKIQGREIDIYIRNNAEAKAFGKKEVQVKVLKLGDGDLDNKRARAR